MTGSRRDLCFAEPVYQEFLNLNFRRLRSVLKSVKFLEKKWKAQAICFEVDFSRILTNFFVSLNFQCRLYFGFYFRDPETRFSGFLD